jgi:hypothetical protein
MDFVTKLLQGLAFLPTVINGVESFFTGRSGTEKKEAALSFVQAALSMADSITSRQIVDEVQFRAGLSTVIDGVVQCLNASAWAKAKP